MEAIPIEPVPNLKKIVCLLSCHPRNIAVQMPQSLDCLWSSLKAQAVGVFWRDHGGELRPLAQRPVRLRLDESPRWGLAGPDGLPDAQFRASSPSRGHHPDSPRLDQWEPCSPGSAVRDRASPLPNRLTFPHNRWPSPYPELGQVLA